MFLKAIQAKLKEKSGIKFLKQELGKPQTAVDRPNGIRSVGCIVDLDNFDTSEVFYELLEDFSLRPNAVKIIGYKSLHDKNSPYATPIFSDKDLGWNGQIANSYALEFLSREYDLLLNYYNENKLMPQLMSLKSKARIRVGFETVDHALNDIMVMTPISDFWKFKSELHKYLRILNEVK